MNVKHRTSEETKKTIIEAAKKLVSEDGVNKTTLREIAKKAGISIGSLYYHYNSKDLILYDVMDQNTRESVKIAKELNEETKKGSLTNKNLEQKAEALTNKIEDRINGVIENKIFFYLAQEAIMGNDELKDKISVKYEAWIDAIEDIIINIYNTPKSPRTKAVANIINATIEGFMLQKLLFIGDPETEKELKEIGRLILCGKFTSIHEFLNIKD